MRRKYLGLAIAAITALGPASAFGGDREIAQEIMTRLKSNRDSGALKDFTLDMKVDQGVVLFRGSVSESRQKQLVLAAAEGIDGIEKVVDEVTVRTVKAEANAAGAKVVKPKAAKVLTARNDDASLRDMLLSEGPDSAAEPQLAAEKPAETLAEKVARESANLQAEPEMIAAQEIVPGEVQKTAAVEFAAASAANDQQLVADVVGALGAAQQQGTLRGFGVDVKSSGGIVTLKGRAANESVREQIVGITESVPGVQGINEQIAVITAPAPPQAAADGVPAQLASSRMAPVSVDEVPTMVAPQPRREATPVTQVAAPVMQTQAAAPVMGSPVAGSPMPAAPVPMNYGTPVGAPRYDAPNLPNYAWPGYAAYPNYAALTYPQQYSPTAWPYIGPFYPYPQVPLGWRKVSLEWDDGWWFLDFTDR
jgi:osmotically-inducible protein OsmY